MSVDTTKIWRLADKTIDCSRPRIIAIVNATPDSFYSPSRYCAGPGLADALARLVAQTPDAVDIGGQSSRPGSERISVDEELRRVIPVVSALRHLDPALPITIDTFQAQVVREALAAGADGVNDISAGKLDSALLQEVVDSDCGYVLMHMQGTPETMQHQPQYGDCVREIGEFMKQHLGWLKRAGVKLDRVVLDPGVGFGKRLADNLELIQSADELAKIGRPLLYGISRKSFIGKLTGADDPVDRLPGTLGVTWELLNKGVMLHRVHDPGPVRQVFLLWEALRK